MLLLLHWLIDRNHPVFKGKGTCAELKARMQAAVEREYPETEADVPREKREGHIPASLLALLDERHAAEARGSTDDVSRAARAKRIRLTSVNDEKNATPGAAARDPGDCLTDVQPVYVSMDRSARSQSDPATQRENAVLAYDTTQLTIQTSAKFVDTWDSSYAWKAFPYAITRPVSGGDFRPDQGRGRRHAESPVLLPTQFLKMLSRRSAAAPCPCARSSRGTGRSRESRLSAALSARSSTPLDPPHTNS